jgi:very-short-patch-repair endonuclease
VQSYAKNGSLEPFFAFFFGIVMEMKTLILLLIVIAAIVLIAKLASARKAPLAAAKEAPVYSYGRKDFLMTKAENDFFSVLKELLQDKYQIFPQVHLTALLDEKKVKGQNWKAAFRHINGKSVDFVVCDKTYTRPILAIELDDSSHDVEERRSRDAEVERIFENANMPLLRFRDYETMAHEAIASQIQAALQSPNQVGAETTSAHH